MGLGGGRWDIWVALSPILYSSVSSRAGREPAGGGARGWRGGAQGGARRRPPRAGRGGERCHASCWFEPAAERLDRCLGRLRWASAWLSATLSTALPHPQGEARAASARTAAAACANALRAQEVDAQAEEVRLVGRMHGGQDGMDRAAMPRCASTRCALHACPLNLMRCPLATLRPTRPRLQLAAAQANAERQGGRAQAAEEQVGGRAVYTSGVPPRVPGPTAARCAVAHTSWRPPTPPSRSASWRRRPSRPRAACAGTSWRLRC